MPFAERAQKRVREHLNVGRTLAQRGDMKVYTDKKLDITKQVVGAVLGT